MAAASSIELLCLGGHLTLGEWHRLITLDRVTAQQPTSGPVLGGTDADSFRHVLGHYPTGVAVVTATTADGPVGMAVNSFTSLSLRPPLVLFCPAVTSTTWPALRLAGNIAVNVLSARQEAVSRAFAARGRDRFRDVSWTVGSNGAPLLDDALGWLECTVQAEYPAGDHIVVIAGIDQMGVHDAIADPLVFFKGAYFPGIEAAVDADAGAAATGDGPGGGAHRAG
jgi:3-hydroxy-9,10-secoandrosta-1,3,5(10)-triene-9,17-dione monooxygenase reductase component